ncbi:hypothetical protein LSAT2_025965 [Lamellibrachia satsuma]|nr:hypothetical protein LSAT2_025965 [Lamellibrachia satsuma]
MKSYEELGLLRQAAPQARYRGLQLRITCWEQTDTLLCHIDPACRLCPVVSPDYCRTHDCQFPPITSGSCTVFG